MKSLYKSFLGLTLLACALILMQACKPSIPSEYLSKGEMEDILYEFHIAEAMSRANYSAQSNGDMITYREAIFKKHGITSAEFDSSMVYYMRHTKLMHDIYVRLGDRLTAEAQSLGVDVSNNNQFGNVASGDTANVWKDATSLVLSTYQPFNYHSFEIPVDSGFHKGDKLILDFESQFLYQDGMRDGVAVLAVTFKNDSVASNNVRMTSSQHFTLQVEDRDSLGIKSVKGYFLLNRGDFISGSSSSTTLKMMFLQNIKLIRMHPQKPVSSPSNGATGDSARAVQSAGGPAQVSPNGASSQAPVQAEPVFEAPAPNGPQPVLQTPADRPLPPKRLRR